MRTTPLLPCPFCAQRDITIKNESPGDLAGGYFIECPDCGASTCMRYACGDDPRPLLAEFWNRRAPSQCLHQISEPTPAPAAVAPQDFEEWAEAEGLTATSYGIRSEHSMLAGFRKAWEAGRRQPAAVAVPTREDRAAWFALAMGAAASIEDAANCLRDKDAKKAAMGAVTHVRESCNKLWWAAPALEAPAAPTLPASVREALAFYAGGTEHWITFGAGRAESLSRHRASSDWREAGEDGRGHEHFVVTSAKAEAALYELDEWLAAAPQAPAHEAPAAPIQHQGMTITGNGAAELGKLMREQRDSRLGVYPDGNPNSGRP